MSRFVVDARALLSIIDGGPPVHVDHDLVAPNSVRSQTLELILARVREGGLTRRDAHLVLDRLAAVKLRALNDRVSRRLAFDIALEQGWDTLRDAECLAVTRLAADALVAGEPRLAALAEGLVPVAPLDALSRP